MVEATLRINYLGTTLLEVGFENVLTDVAAGTPITSGSVTADIHEKATPFAKLGATITLAHVTGGLWRGIVTDTHSDFVDGQPILVKLTIDGGANLKDYREIPGIVRVRAS